MARKEKGIAERAEEAVGGIEKRKLYAVYQFAQAMPLLFVPVTNNKGRTNNKGGEN